MGGSGSGTQNPCRDKTNTATNFWRRSAGAVFADLVPPIREAVQDLARRVAGLVLEDWHAAPTIRGARAS